MELKIENFRYLPCSLKVFTINGKDANYEDFGEQLMNGKSCMDGECGCEFRPKMPTEEVLEKYGITLGEYSKIAMELKDKLYVFSCGWCS